MTIESNKQTVRAYYEMAFGGQPELAARRYIGPSYTQHNPAAKDGPDAFITFVNHLRASHPELRLDIKRIFGEGDFVITHSHLILERDKPGQALADFFRLEDGKVVEHWDVIQAIPTETANSNGMF